MKVTGIRCWATLSDTAFTEFFDSFAQILATKSQHSHVPAFTHPGLPSCETSWVQSCAAWSSQDVTCHYIKRTWLTSRYHTGFFQSGLSDSALSPSLSNEVSISPSLSVTLLHQPSLSEAPLRLPGRERTRSDILLSLKSVSHIFSVFLLFCHSAIKVKLCLLHIQSIFDLSGGSFCSYIMVLYIEKLQPFCPQSNTARPGPIKTTRSIWCEIVNIADTTKTVRHTVVLQAKERVCEMISSFQAVE